MNEKSEEVKQPELESIMNKLINLEKSLRVNVSQINSKVHKILPIPPLPESEPKKESKPTDGYVERIDEQLKFIDSSIYDLERINTHLTTITG